jgi:hypothetical protein
MKHPLHCPLVSHTRHTWAGGWCCWVCPAWSLDNQTPYVTRRQQIRFLFTSQADVGESDR